MTEITKCDVKTEKNELKPDNIARYLNDFFKKDIARFKSCKEIKTGFDNLDNKIGSLYPGLYTIGAASDLGKTTFVHQMADQIAINGHDVLFFSLEQSRFELVSKSIARFTVQSGIKAASNALSIRKGEFINAGNDKEKSILNACNNYKKSVGDRLSIIEGNFETNINTIKETVDIYIKNNNAKPVVIIDYLQGVQTAYEKTTKETIDFTITELKRLSRDKGIVVIVISSLNRNSYLNQMDFESFKETGSIEYTSDVVWGLQLQVMNTNSYERQKDLKVKREIIRNAKTKNPRKIELVCLKNRYGISSFKIGFMYYPEFDYFTQDINFEEE